MSVDEMQQAFRLKVNDELTVTCFARGTSVLLFAVREWDAKVIRLPGSYNKSRGSSEQAMRASIRQAVSSIARVCCGVGEWWRTGCNMMSVSWRNMLVDLADRLLLVVRSCVLGWLLTKCIQGIEPLG